MEYCFLFGHSNDYFTKLITIYRISAIVFIVTLVTYQLRQYFKIVWLALNLPGPPAYPFIGNSLIVFDDKYAAELGLNVQVKYGPVVRAWMSIIPIIGILEPQHIQKVILSSKHQEKMFVYSWMEAVVGKGLVTSQGDEWKKHRRLIQPAFSGSLSHFIPIFENGAKLLLKSIDQEIQGNATKAIKITTLINVHVFEILNEIVFGIPQAKEKEVSLTDSFRVGTLTWPERLRQPWLIFGPIYRNSQIGRREMEQQRSIKLIIRKLITEKRNNLNKEDNSLLSFMLRTNFTDKECIDQVSTFMFAGQDTIAGTLAFTLYHLARHQDIQTRAIEEIDRIFQDDRCITREDVRQLTYLKQCIKETLRLFPSVTMFGRTMVEDLELDGHILPKGTSVIIVPYATHRLPKYFPDPTTFNPERFNLRNLDDLPPCAYIPFSAGPRICIGNTFAMIELQTIICTILRRFRVSLLPGREELSVKFRITIRISGGLWLQFTERNNQYK